MSGMMVMMLMAMKMIMMLVETAMIGCWWWWHDGDDDENDADDEDDDDDAVCEKCIGLESCGGVQVTDHSLGRVLATYKYLHKYTLLTNIYQWCTNIYTNMHCLQWCIIRSVGKSWPKACTAPLGLDTEESHSHKPHNCPAIMMIITITNDCVTRAPLLYFLRSWVALSL